MLRINLGATRVRQRTYLRFDLAAVPPGAAIQSAELDLYQTVGSAGSILVYGVASDWDATKTTWNNQPDVGSFESWNAPPPPTNIFPLPAAFLRHSCRIG